MALLHIVGLMIGTKWPYCHVAGLALEILFILESWHNMV
jgi:hypothetical protein